MAWAGLALGGLVALTRYAGTPGASASAPARWPAESQVTRETGRPTALFFAHPRCPCTRASVQELGRLVARAGAGVDVTVLLACPAGAPSDWAETDLARAAAAIPGVRVVRDEDEREAARFGVVTSGQVLLYDGAGALRFAGGITAGRGHAGDNANRAALEAALGGAVARADAPVFGCELEARRGASTGGTSWTP